MSKSIQLVNFTSTVSCWGGYWSCLPFSLLFSLFNILTVDKKGRKRSAESGSDGELWGLPESGSDEELSLADSSYSEEESSADITDQPNTDEKVQHCTLL